MDTLTAVQGDTHPLLLLLSDLKSSLVNFQNEAHASAVKLQHHSLSTSRALERTHALEHEISVLNDELHILRSNPHPFSSKDRGGAGHESINQLTLSLRTLNEKLTATEAILARRTAELTHTVGELEKSKSATDTAHELSAHIRGREEALKSRERELELKVLMAEERARMSERAVEEYADLVRTLEGRTAGGVQINGHAIRSTGDEDIQHTLQELAREKENLQIQLSSSRHDLALLTSEHTALNKSVAVTLAELADLRIKLQLLGRDDTTATKMVSRYMKFSQAQTNHLQNTLSTLSTRHAATLSSLTTQTQSLNHALALAQSHNTRLLSALDNLGNEVMREGYGRRREVRLRIKLIGREERVLEGLRRWLRRAEEGYVKICGNSGASNHGGEGSALAEMIQDAKILIDNLDDPLLLTTQHNQDVHPPPISGSLARLFTIQSTVDDLMDDVQREQAKRIALEKLVVRQEVEGALDGSMEKKKVKLVFQPKNGLEEKVNLSDLAVELCHDGSSTLNPAVRLPLSSVPNTDSPSYRVMDATPSRSLPSTNNGTAPPDPEPEHALIPDTTGETLPISPPVSTPVRGPQLQPWTPTIEIEPPLSPDQSTPQSFDSIESVSEAQAGTGQQDMIPGREGRTRPVSEAVCDGMRTKEGDATRNLSGVDISALELRSTVDIIEKFKVSEGRETLAGGVLDGETADLLGDALVEGAELDIKKASTMGVEEIRENEKESTEAAPTVNNSHPSEFDTNPSIEPTESRPPSQVPTHSLSPLLPSSPNPPSIQLPSQLHELTPLAPHPLLHDLSKARNRYDHIQRAFHACHIALEGLKAVLPSTSTNTDSGSIPYVQPRYPLDTSGDSLPSSSMMIPNDVLSAIVQRLDDYTEDVRVELEIRISDEEVIGRGYEALLMLPGALSSAMSPSSSSTPGDETNDNTGLAVDMETQIRAFIDGTDSTISRAITSFERKLVDIEHDIVTVKKVIHDPQSVFQPPSPTTTAIELSEDSAPSTGWTSWIRTPISRPTTPTLAPAPTFGNIMTNRNTRSSSTLRRTVSNLGQSSDSLPVSSGSTDFVKSLGLKVPMPNLGFAFTPPSSGSLFGGGNDESSESPNSAAMSFGGLGLGHGFGAQRSRTISTSVYMLGMGMGSPGVGVGMPGKKSPVVLPLQRRVVSATLALPTGAGCGGENAPGSYTDVIGGKVDGHDEEDVD